MTAVLCQPPFHYLQLHMLIEDQFYIVTKHHRLYALPPMKGANQFFVHWQGDMIIVVICILTLHFLILDCPSNNILNGRKLWPFKPWDSIPADPHNEVACIVHGGNVSVLFCCGAGRMEEQLWEEDNKQNQK